jgi:hypothetical protein
MGTASDDVKKLQFPNFLEPDSVADDWFEDLKQDSKKDWAAIEASFNKRWPRKKAVKKTTEEYEQEITNLRLKMDDMGKKETVAGREVYSHVAWADDMAVIVRGAKLETTTTLIGHVRKELPKLLREKVGTGHADWEAFLQAVRDVDTDHIRDGVDIWRKEEDSKKKEQEARKKELEDQETLRRRIQQLEKLSASPTAPLRQQMSSFNIGNPTPSISQPHTQPGPANPFASNTGGQGNLFYPPQAKNYITRQPKTPCDASRQSHPLTSSLEIPTPSRHGSGQTGTPGPTSRLGEITRSEHNDHRGNPLPLTTRNSSGGIRRMFHLWTPRPYGTS